MNKKILISAVSCILCAAVCVGAYFIYSSNAPASELFSKKNASEVNGKAGGAVDISAQANAAEVSYEYVPYRYEYKRQKHDSPL